LRFSVGVNYWPRSSALAMWRRFDAGEIREDFARIAGLGLDTVRFFARWDDFQPRADAVDPSMLDRLATVVDAAAAAGLQTIPTLFTGHVGGDAWVPAWAYEPKTPRRVGNIYAGRLLDAQLFFAREVGTRLREHPAVRAWDIGHAFSDVRAPARGKISTGDHGSVPAAEREVAEWSRRLTAELAGSSALPVTAGTHSGDLENDREIRLGSLCAPFAFASMQGSSVVSRFARNRLDPEVVPFLAMLAAAFSFKPVFVTGFGNPTCPPEKFSALERFPFPGERTELTISPDDTVFATYPCSSEHENAAYCTAVLERLHADGRLGALWWCWADYDEHVHDEPPFDRAPHERTYGIVRSDGSEKPVAAALAAFAAQRRSVVKANDMPMISSTYFYRTLPTSAKTLYDAFLGFVRERRND
jgi:hypothetical protein